MNKTKVSVSLLAMAMATAMGTASAAPDWSKAPSKKITLLYPGHSGLEWVMKGVDHSGAKAVKGGETCAGCHDKEAADIGKKIVSGEKLDTKPIKGKAGSIPVTVQAAHDGANLYLRFQWKAPAGGGPKLDATNQVKLTVMMDAGKVEYATQGGCWATCHNDLRSMDDANDGAAKKHPKAGALGWSDGVTKYLKESRTELTIKEKPRGGVCVEMKAITDYLIDPVDDPAAAKWCIFRSKIAYADAERLYREAARLPHLRVCGIGFHIGSLMTDSAPFMPHAQGTRAESFAVISRMPAGSGIPISTPAPSRWK